MKNTLLVLVATSLLFGCAGAPPAGRPVRKEVFDDEIHSLGSYEEMEKDLTRSQCLGCGFMDSFSLVKTYATYVETHPVTRKLIEAHEREEGKRKLDSSEVISKNITTYTDALTKNNTCFEFVVSTSGDIESAQFKNWSAKLEDASGTLYPITFKNLAGVESVPASKRLFGGAFVWINTSNGCVDKKVALDKGFKIHAFPPSWYGDSAQKTMVWTVE